MKDENVKMRKVTVSFNELKEKLGLTGEIDFMSMSYVNKELRIDLII